MPKQVIFLVHGMGDTSTGWSKPVQELIKSKYDLYKVSTREKFNSNFVFKEINYNHVFEDHIQTWKENSALLTNKLEASGTDEKVLESLTSIPNKAARESFANTHILDVILYRFMKGLKSQVITDISNQIVGKLNDSIVSNNLPKYSIVCHSLGTAVMHDVMQANLTTSHLPLSTAYGIPNTYMTIANVSRVLEDSDTSVYTSAVRPRLKDRGKLYGCTRFINVRHELDPFTKVRTFNPPWKKGAAKPLNNLHSDSYENIKISGLTDINPHDLEHYLENPDTHVALFKGLSGKRAISQKEHDAQMLIHKQKTAAGQFNEVRTAVNNIDISDDSSIATAFQAWLAFQTFVEGKLSQI